MLLAEWFDQDGKSKGPVAADAFDKAGFYELSVRDRLRCTACGKTATHVSGHMADGNAVERIAHFRAKHKDDCDLADEARDDERTQSVKDALAAGRQILINIDFDLGFKKSSLSLKFNPVANPEGSGLWEKAAWTKWVKNTTGRKHLSVPAHDITDILYYLELAKESGGKEALSRLWFNTDRIVQASKRFVVSDSQAKSQWLLQSLINRAQSTRTQSKELRDSPRLFRFHVTTSQARHAQKKAEHTIYGQAVDVDLSIANGYGDMRTKSHTLKLAMRFAEDSGLDNKAVMQEGSDLWVVATPTLTRKRAHEIAAKVIGDVSSHVNPAFCYLRVLQRLQFVKRTSAPAQPAP